MEESPRMVALLPCGKKMMFYILLCKPIHLIYIKELTRLGIKSQLIGKQSNQEQSKLEKKETVENHV